MRTMSLDRNFYFAHWYLGLAYMHKKMHREAIRSLETALELAGLIPAIVASLGHCLTRNLVGTILVGTAVGRRDLGRDRLR